MSLNLNTGSFTVTMNYTEMITGAHAAALKARRAAGLPMANVPRPRSLAEAPMLSVAALKNAGVDVPFNWLPTDVVCPIMPEGHGTFRIRLSGPSGDVAYLVDVKGINVKTSRTLDESGGFSLHDDGRQNYLVGDFDLGGWVSANSVTVRQFAVLSKKQARADVATYLGQAPTHPYGDAVRIGIFFPTMMEKLLQISSAPIYPYGLETYRSVAPAAMAMPSELVTKGVLIGAGGELDEEHPDDPSVTAADFQRQATFVICVRLVPVAYFNDLARGIEAKEFSFEQMQALVKAQSDFDRRMGVKLQVGVDTGSAVDELPEIPFDEDGDDGGQELLFPKGSLE